MLAFFSYIFLGEKFGPQGYFGTILILAGVWYSATGGNEKEVEEAEGKEEKGSKILNFESVSGIEKIEN